MDRGSMFCIRPSEKDPIKSRSQLAGSQDFAIEDEICDTQVIPLVEIFEEYSFNEKEEVIGKILFELIFA